MKVYALPLAERYARAFLQVYGHTLNEQSLDRLNDIIDYVEQHKSMLSLLQLAVFSAETKHEMVVHMSEQLSLSIEYQQLMELLVKHKRIHILSTVLQQVASLYERKQGITSFRVITVAPLSSDDIAQVKTFLYRHHHQQVRLSPVQDETLVAGIRLQSDRW